MKAATGELSLTLITVVAVGAILAFFWALWPTIKGKISGSFSDFENDAQESGFKTESNVELSYIDEVYNSIM